MLVPRCSPNMLRQDASFVIDENQLLESFGGIGDALFAAHPRPSGMTMDQMLGNSAVSGKPGSTFSSSSAVVAAAASVSDEDERLNKRSRLTFARPDITVNLVVAAPFDSPREKGKQTGKPKSASKDGPRASIPKREGGDEGGGGSARKRGRPMRSRLDIAMDILSDFKECQRGEKYFNQQPNFRRSLERGLKEFSALIGIEGVDGYANDDKHNIFKKQLQTCVEISKLWMKEESFNDTFSTNYKQSLAFLKIAPETPLPFPDWLMQLHIAHEVEALRTQLC
jgi:hypothetical protein